MLTSQAKSSRYWTSEASKQLALLRSPGHTLRPVLTGSRAAIAWVPDWRQDLPSQSDQGSLWRSISQSDWNIVATAEAATLVVSSLANEDDKPPAGSWTQVQSIQFASYNEHQGLLSVKVLIKPTFWAYVTETHTVNIVVVKANAKCAMAVLLRASQQWCTCHDKAKSQGSRLARQSNDHYSNCLNQPQSLPGSGDYSISNRLLKCDIIVAPANYLYATKFAHMPWAIDSIKTLQDLCFLRTHCGWVKLFVHGKGNPEVLSYIKQLRSEIEAVRGNDARTLQAKIEIQGIFPSQSASAIHGKPRKGKSVWPSKAQVHTKAAKQRKQRSKRTPSAASVVRQLVAQTRQLLQSVQVYRPWYGFGVPRVDQPKFNSHYRDLLTWFYQQANDAQRWAFIDRAQELFPQLMRFDQPPEEMLHPMQPIWPSWKQALPGVLAYDIMHLLLARLTSNTSSIVMQYVSYGNGA